MSCRTNENIEPFFCFRLPLCGIFFQPVFRLLFANRGNDHGNRAVERSEDFFFWNLLRLSELPVAVAYITRLRNARANVIVQISGQMKDQVPDTISIGIRLSPKLFRRKAPGPLVHIFPHHLVIRGQILGNRLRQIRHSWSPPTCSVRSCKSSLLSSQRKHVLSDGCFAKDRPAPPQRLPAFQFPATQSCPRVRVNRHRSKSPPSAPQSASSPNPPSDETLPHFVRADRPTNPSLNRS